MKTETEIAKEQECDCECNYCRGTCEGKDTIGCCNQIFKKKNKSETQIAESNIIGYKHHPNLYEESIDNHKEHLKRELEKWEEIRRQIQYNPKIDDIRIHIVMKIVNKNIKEIRQALKVYGEKS